MPKVAAVVAEEVAGAVRVAQAAVVHQAEAPAVPPVALQ
jgi:hypothetical protein